jgi:hypothetical protein
VGRSLVALTVALATSIVACSGDSGTGPQVASVVVKTGDQQTGLAGHAVNVRPAVVVRDGSNLPMPGVPVVFAPVFGGSVAGSPVVTDANGIATVGSWTVELGSNTLTAVAGSGRATFHATGVAPAYTIDVRYVTGVTPARLAAFQKARARWERLIYGDVPDVAFTAGPGMCGPTAPAFNEPIDDIVILVAFESIDGPGQILGSAGPCWIRNDHLPILSLMRFDIADIAGVESAGLLDAVVLHEMGHALGYGTIWKLRNLVVGAAGTDPQFVGAQATATYARNVPVENTGGPGTRDTHWRETVFDRELMTGWLDAGLNTLSAITTASMGDLGYTVNYAASDSYTVPDAAALRALGLRIELNDDILRLPIHVVGAGGQVLQVINGK